MIQIHKVTKKFGEREALHQIDLTLPEGKLIGLVGPDGAGKTTLLRMIAALMVPTHGKITVGGFDTVSQSESIHEILGYMPQRFGLYEDLSVIQNMNLYAELNESGKESFDKLLHFTGLAPFTKRLAGQLSGGMKQKLGLACTLIRKPKLLILDEPSVGVDPISRRELWDLFKELMKEKITILMSTNYIDEGNQCDQVVTLSEGKIIDHFVTKEAIEPLRHEIGEPVILVKELTKQFDHFTAVDKVSFDIKRGEIFGLLGPNGAGKTTMFKMLCGLLKPTSGTAVIEEKHNIGYMAQKFSLYGNLSVLQNLKFFNGIYRADPKEIDRMIEIFHLEPFVHFNANDLSFGYRQRLSLACAIMHHPQVLFLDEPTAGVDPATRQEFWHHIQSLKVTVVVTTHVMDEAEYCDRIGLMHQGKILMLGSPSELKQKAGKENLEEAFIHLIERGHER